MRTPLRPLAEPPVVAGSRGAAHGPKCQSDEASDMHRHPGERTTHAHYVGRPRRFEPARMAFVDLFDVVEGVPCTRRPLAIGPVTAAAHVGIDLNVRIGDVLLGDLLGRDLAVDLTGPILLVVGYY